MTEALRLERVTKRFGSAEVVHQVSCTVQRGEFFGLLGQNGAGKSTIINMISGVARISEGRIFVSGFDTEREYVQTRQRIGVMHQDPVIEQYFPIGKALALHSGYYGKPDDPAWREQITDRLELGPHLSKKFLRLSGGTKRRFMLAKALLHKPELLILDEPTAGVDIDLRHQLWEFVKEINRAGTTIVLTTHYLEEAERLCDRIAILKDGRLQRVAPTAELLQEIGEQQIRIAFDSSIEEAVGLFDGLCCTVLDRQTLQFVARSAHEATDIWRRVKAIPQHVVNVETVSPDLEDVFLKVIKSDVQ